MSNYRLGIKAAAKQKGVLWQPILLILVIAFIIYLLLFGAHFSKTQVMPLYLPGKIARVKMKVVSGAGVNNVVLSDSLLLDSMNAAFVQAKPINVPRGGAFEMWADMEVYKNGRKIDIRINHSVYHGWMMEVGNETLSSKYIFGLVRRYAKQ